MTQALLLIWVYTSAVLMGARDPEIARWASYLCWVYVGLCSIKIAGLLMSQARAIESVKRMRTNPHQWLALAASPTTLLFAALNGHVLMAIILVVHCAIVKQVLLNTETR